MEIDKTIIAQTTKCKKDIACLKDNGFNICKVSECINNEVHFLECNCDNRCNYRTSFGFKYLCDCPVRKEIYNKYNQ